MSNNEIDGARSFINSIALIARAFQANQDQVRLFLEGLAERIRAVGSVIQLVDQHLQSLNADGKVMERLQSAFDDLQAKGWETFVRAARLGWFLPTPPEFPAGDLMGMYDALEKGNAAVNAFMEQWIDGRIANIREIIIDSYPHRFEIFNSVFEAHRIRQYNLSVPVFLAQADGIWSEWISASGFREIVPDKKSLYSKTGASDQQTPWSAKVISKLEADETVDEMVLKWLGPLGIVTALHADEDKMSADLIGLLNRHGVIHGRSLDYGTKINSLKSISVVLFVATLPVLLQRDGD